MNSASPVLLCALSLLLCSSLSEAQDNLEMSLVSPRGKIDVQVRLGPTLMWSVRSGSHQIIAPSEISLTLGDGTVLGANGALLSHEQRTIDTVFESINHIKDHVRDHCTQLTLRFKGEYGVIFRAYDDAVAYRFFSLKHGEIVVRNEEASFNFGHDDSAFIPIMWDYRGGQKFNSSFEALYRHIRISQFPKDSLAFLPVLVEAGGGKNVVLLEADLEDYPGMYLDANTSHDGFVGVFAQYPLETQQGGFGQMNLIPTKRADFIAKTMGPRSFPWRVVVISDQDMDLLDNDIVQKLASPARVNDASWIRPGQVAWDWWNDWNISHVDFRAGINTTTYKHYIDFAASNGIPYVILDGGWSETFDLRKAAKGLDVKEVVDYGEQKGVGVILWASWLTITRQMDDVFPFYADMGVKGFKIDFVDRDDQIAVASLYEIAKKAAENHLLVDYHGVYKPTGIQRTYPNVVGNEGVRGMEYQKWSSDDALPYAVSIPFIRMLAGPMDYTPGAMRNATRADFRPINDMPMSQGTRCQQLATYIVYAVPLQMLSDNPTIYMKEQECTDFITKVPTVFDETVPLDGKVGEYCAIARRKGIVWYLGAMTNWDARTLSIPLGFLGPGRFLATIFKDGINADRDATDYKKELRLVMPSDTLSIHLAPGGGWAARLMRAE